MTHIADNPDALLDYVYEEGHPAERLKIARHLQNCATCSVAVLELQEVRGLLKDWAPPSSELGFKIVQENGPEPVRPWWRPPVGAPMWTQAAAATLIFALGVGVSQLHVNVANGTLTVSTQAPVPTQAARAAPAIRVTPAPAAVAQTPSTLESARASSPGQPSMDELEKRMRALIAQSEERQERQLGLRVVQMASELDSQRLADMRRVEQNLGDLEITTGAEIQQQRQLVDYLVRTSGTAK